MGTTARPAGGRSGNTVSLDRALSKRGLASRSEARALILQGRVRVDGRTLTNPSTRIIPERVAIAIDGVPRRAASAPLTIVLHKPRGYVTTRSDPEGRKTIYDLLTDLPERVVPVGRLDLATSGLLILTNDTQFGNWLTDPSSEIPRVYVVTVKGEATDDVAAKLIAGISTGAERLIAANVLIRKRSRRESHLIITLTEGKNREIRRMLAAVDHPVTALKRVQLGGLELGTLAPGKWRRVPPEELRAAFPAYSFARSAQDEPSSRAPRPK